MARWHSPMLAHYAGLAPLKAITSEFLKRIPRRNADGPAPSAKSDIAAQLAAMTSTLAALVDKERRLESAVNKLQFSVRSTPYIVNSNGRWHLEHDENLRDSPLTWRSACGWKYGLSSYSREAALPGTITSRSLCEKCLPVLKADLQLSETRPARPASSDTSGSGANDESSS